MAQSKASDPECDGEPLEPEPSTISKPMKIKETSAPYGGGSDEPKKKKLKIKLGDGKEREIQHTMQDEAQLRKIWSNPTTRKILLDKLAESTKNQIFCNK